MDKGSLLEAHSNSKIPWLAKTNSECLLFTGYITQNRANILWQIVEPITSDLFCVICSHSSLVIVSRECFRQARVYVLFWSNSRRGEQIFMRIWKAVVWSGKAGLHSDVQEFHTASCGLFILYQKHSPLHFPQGLGWWKRSHFYWNDHRVQGGKVQWEEGWIMELIHTKIVNPHDLCTTDDIVEIMNKHGCLNVFNTPLRWDSVLSLG